MSNLTEIAYYAGGLASALRAAKITSAALQLSPDDFRQLKYLALCDSEVVEDRANHKTEIASLPIRVVYGVDPRPSP